MIPESSRSARGTNSDETIKPKLVKQEEILTARKTEVESEHILSSLIGDDNKDSKEFSGTEPIKIKKCMK